LETAPCAEQEYEQEDVSFHIGIIFLIEYYHSINCAGKGTDYCQSRQTQMLQEVSCVLH
jgi:hypothetical protein